MSDHDDYHADRAMRAALERKKIRDAEDRILVLRAQEEHARHVALTRACAVGPGRCEYLPFDAPAGSNPSIDNTGFSDGII